MSTEPRPPRPRLAESLHGIVDAGLQTAQTRLELLAVELQEEKLRPTALALHTVLARFLWRSSRRSN